MRVTGQAPRTGLHVTSLMPLRLAPRMRMRVLRGHEPGVELWSCAIKWHAIGTMRSGYVAGVIGSDSRVAREVLAIMVIGSAVAAAATTARTDLRSLVDLRNATPYR